MRALPLCLVTIGVSAWSIVASADPIRVFQDARIAATDALIVLHNHPTTVADRDDAADDLAASISLSVGDIFATGAATLSSSVMSHQASGAGTLSATAAVLPSSDVFRSALTGAISDFILGFDLDTPHRFSFSSLFTATSGVESDADLEGPAGVVFFQSPAMSSGEFQASGLLPAGRYGLRVFQTVQVTANGLGGAASQHGQYSFTFDLTPASAVTPEPASLILLGSGLLGLAGMRWRRSVEEGP